MPNQPKTPVRSVRLSDEAVDQLKRLAGTAGTLSEGCRKAVEALTASSRLGVPDRGSDGVAHRLHDLANLVRQGFAISPNELESLAEDVRSTPSPGARAHVLAPINVEVSATYGDRPVFLVKLLMPTDADAQILWDMAKDKATVLVRPAD